MVWERIRKVYSSYNWDTVLEVSMTWKAQHLVSFPDRMESTNIVMASSTSHVAQAVAVEAFYFPGGEVW